MSVRISHGDCDDHLISFDLRFHREHSFESADDLVDLPDWISAQEIGEGALDWKTAVFLCFVAQYCGQGKTMTNLYWCWDHPQTSPN